jgi:hypothetical protein
MPDPVISTSAPLAEPVADATVILRFAGPAILSRSAAGPLSGTP